MKNFSTEVREGHWHGYSGKRITDVVNIGVGGRFSLWSAIGLPIALDLGFDKFIELLEGAHEMDCHFQQTPLRENAPIILALLSVWNCTFLGAQSQALMSGVNAEQVCADLKAKGRLPNYIDKVAPHKVHKGNRPTNTLLLKRIEPRSLGSLIALYEHKIFVQGIILKICSFDQWGVELGKGLANKIASELDSGTINQAHDSSTLELIKYYQSARK